VQLALLSCFGFCLTFTLLLLMQQQILVLMDLSIAWELASVASVHIHPQQNSLWRSVSALSGHPIPWLL